jgi:3-hydroxyisobutyrate dehydrogenase-like beta-hydroxyacid dehydrogenase
MSPKTGMIGLGQMGRGMALNLHRKTAGISVFDMSDKAMDQLAQAGATPVQSAADLANTCDIISCACQQIKKQRPRCLGRMVLWLANAAIAS